MPPAKTETLVTPAAQLDQRDAQLALLLAQAGLARRDRRGDDRFDAEMGGADAQIEILAPARGSAAMTWMSTASLSAWRPRGCLTPSTPSIV